MGLKKNVYFCFHWVQLFIYYPVNAISQRLTPNFIQQLSSFLEASEVTAYDRITEHVTAHTAHCFRFDLCVAAIKWFCLVFYSYSALVCYQSAFSSEVNICTFSSSSSSPAFLWSFSFSCEQEQRHIKLAEAAGAKTFAPQCVKPRLKPRFHALQSLQSC